MNDDNLGSNVNNCQNRSERELIQLFRIISIPSFFFSSARSRDFDGLIGIELPVSMYTTKTPIDYFSV